MGLRNGRGRGRARKYLWDVLESPQGTSQTTIGLSPGIQLKAEPLMEPSVTTATRSLFSLGQRSGSL